MFAKVVCIVEDDNNFANGVRSIRMTYSLRSISVTELEERGLWHAIRIFFHEFYCMTDLE